MLLRKTGMGVVALMLTLAGCGKEQTAPPSAPPATPPNSAPAASTPAAPGGVTLADLDKVTKANAPYKIVLIVKTRNNPFFRPMIEAFEQTAKELGVEPEVQAPPQEMDKEKQFGLVQTEVSKGVKAICIAPADSKGIVPALKQAQDRGVLVINLDNRVDPATARAQGLELSGYVGADNQEGGRRAGEAMVQTLAAKRIQGGKVAVLEGIRGVDNAEARKRGFTEAVKGTLSIDASETAEWDREKGYQKTQNILARLPDLNGLFCANDMMAVGAMKAIAEAGKKGQIVVIGYDNIPDVQTALSTGEMTATIEQHPDLMGKYGLKMAVGVLNGTVPKGGEIFVPLEVIKRK